MDPIVHTKVIGLAVPVCTLGEWEVLPAEQGRRTFGVGVSGVKGRDGVNIIATESSADVEGLCEFV